MTALRQNESSSSAARMRRAEETLRVIASLPAPEGLVERVQTGLRAAPRASRLLRFPGGLMSGGWMYSTALRGAAAAAIVCVVAAGGWRIYSRVQPAPTAKVIEMPARVGNSGFSSAGAKRTPDTLTGPAVPKTITAAQAPAIHRKSAAKKKKTASAQP